MLSTQILGCRVDAVDLDEAVAFAVHAAHGTTSTQIVTLGTEMIVYAQRDARFRDLVAGAGLVVCDTVGVMLASRSRGGPVHSRVTGVDLLEALAGRSGRDGLHFYLLGGKGDTAIRAVQALRSRFTDVHVAGARDGYFGPDEDDSVAREIEVSGANIVFAGLGSPRQEFWLRDNLAASGARVGIGVGGALDVFAGNVKRAPEAAQRLGLEWLYRLATEPRRIRRQLALPMFAALAVRESALHLLRKTKPR